MKNWKSILLVAGILLLIAAFAAYAARIASCYPAANILAQYSPEYLKGFRQSCKLDSPLTTQFSDFLLLFIPGIILFSSYWLSSRPRVKKRRPGQLSVFLLVVMFDSLLVMLYGLLGYPAPGIADAPPAWAVETIAVLGFLSYLAALALWYWKRWGLLLFQGASISLAVFILLAGRSLVLAAVIVAGVIGLSLLLRPVRNKLE
jgi:ABC-type dipeptide/oligopeptide/nickel transport system permease component